MEKNKERKKLSGSIADTIMLIEVAQALNLINLIWKYK